MNQQKFEQALNDLVTQPLNSAKFEEVKPVVESLLYSDLLPTTVNKLGLTEKRRLLFLLEKFRRYSCASVTRRLQLKTFAHHLSLEQPLTDSPIFNQVDPLARKIGLNEYLNHLKPQLLSLQTRHYQNAHSAFPF